MVSGSAVRMNDAFAQIAGGMEIGAGLADPHRVALDTPRLLPLNQERFAHIPPFIYRNMSLHRWIDHRCSGFLRALDALSTWNIDVKLAVCDPIDHGGKMRMHSVLLTWLPSRLDDKEMIVFMNQFVDIRESFVRRGRDLGHSDGCGNQQGAE
jgi:hypothetical protein